MTFSIDFQCDKSVLKQAANRNIYDAFEWTFAYNMSAKFRRDHDALELDWQSQKTVHDLYEIFNAPHVPVKDRTGQAAQYLAEKVHKLIGENKIRDIRKKEIML